jgi:penicillin amidase
MAISDSSLGSAPPAAVGHPAISESSLRAALPVTSGRLAVAGLEAAVDIHRDRWGIPHLRARSAADIFFAQGYVHAQDRLWQMDSSLRRMLGRWAEWVGRSGVSADMLARRLDIAAASRRDYQALKPDTRAMLDAYTAGVNAYLAEGRSLPVEYALHGGAPEAWEPWHCIAVMRQRGYLMGSVWFKLWRAAALRTIGPDHIMKLRYDDGGGDLLCIPPGAEARRWIADLQALAPGIEAVAALGSADATGGGSNNWAVSPSRTLTGRPLLAGDPHRVFEIPGMYAQMHLACDAFDAIGLTVPGVPAFPHFAHNGRVAWCVTHAFMDIHDLFVERFAEGGASYAFKGKHKPTRRRTDTIQVRGEGPVAFEIVETHHGPVIAGDPGSGAAITLRSVQFAETDLSFDCLCPMLSSKTVEELYESTRGWGLIDHNLVAGDTQGRIGHLVRAVVPKRPRLNGWLPVPGWTGEYEWQADIPWEDMPRAFDPPRGYIVTANNRVVADDYADYLCTDCHPPYRARRIEARLAELPSATSADMKAIHADDVSLTGLEFRAQVAETAPQNEGARRLRDLIAGWDGRMAPDSIPAAAYAAFRWELARLLLERSGLADAARDPLLQVPPPVAPVNQLWWALPSLLRTNDTGLLGGMHWAATIEEALTRTAPKLDGKSWAELHRAKLAHPLAPLFSDAATTLDPPGWGVGGDNDTVLANGSYAAGGLHATYGAVARYVFDVGNWDGCEWVVFGGASGHPGSSHYSDQHQVWAKTELVPMLYDWGRIAAEGDRLTLEPAAV